MGISFRGETLAVVQVPLLEWASSRSNVQIGETPPPPSLRNHKNSESVLSGAL